MKAVVLTLMLCVTLVTARDDVKRKNRPQCGVHPRKCAGKRAWENWKNMMREKAEENREFYPNDEEFKEALKSYENNREEFPNRR
ncbi:Hypothetical predicted protein [Paramuricea clavata]|uniref:Uncharacterized protein n=1 Tax=Paramuricea clavata TaxID=317549 RepID=A0A7D9E2E7_PARCT|nr:Hypothetical predicted protein [Paramuricea clavata]